MINRCANAHFSSTPLLLYSVCYRAFLIQIKMTYLFIFTFGILILNLLVVLTMFGKNTLSLPRYKWLSPTQWWVFYPSFFFQVYWWSVYAGLVNAL